MEEILFHLSNHLERLQIQASVAAQQGQQWFMTFLTQCRHYLRELYNEQHVQHLKHAMLNLLIWMQRNWEQLQIRYYPIYFYHRVTNICVGEVTRREMIFCLTGVTVGALIGYCIAISWSYPPRRIHCMKAVICHNYIGIEGVSVIDDAEMPMIQKSNELLIHVKAASVNVVDTKICQGYARVYRRLLNLSRNKEVPVILGRDCAGVIVEIGQNVINFDIGDEVFLALPSWASGTMAEYLVVPEAQVAKRPKRYSYETSASIPYSGCLAWDILVNKSVIKEGNARGKRVLILEGTTPVGCILVQLVKLWGGYVLTTCKQHAVPVMKALGADEVISLNESNIEKELQLHDKFDAIFYTGGKPIDQKILQQHLNISGSYVSSVPEYLISDSLGFVFGSIFAGYVRTRLLIQYMFGFNTHRWKDGSKITNKYLRVLAELADADQLQPVVDRVYAPYNIEEALHHIVDSDAIGSTIIRFQ